MKRDTKLPDELTPLNLNAYFYNAFAACGCSEFDEMHSTILRLLEWHEIKDARPSYDTLFPEKGVFYLLIGLLDHLKLSEHGTSIRWPWLTDDGRRLLAALRAVSPQEIDGSSGEAYDGCHYGQD